MKKLITLVIVLALLSVNCLALSVSRSFVGSNKVELQVIVGTDDHYIVEEHIPAQWTVTSASDGGDYATTPGKIFWIILNSAGDKTYTYTYSAPDGSYTLNGVYMGPSLSAKANIKGSSSITIGSGGPTPTPTPDFDYTWLIIGGVIFFGIMMVINKTK